MERLQYLRIDGNHIPCGDPWICILKSLQAFTAMRNSCQEKQAPTHEISQPAIPSLADLSIAKIRQFIDDGGDWTDITEVPSHLLEKIIKFAKPIESHETLRLCMCSVCETSKLRLKQAKETTENRKRVVVKPQHSWNKQIC